MESVALRVQKTDGWTCIGSRPDAKKPLDVVVRAFEGPVLVAPGSEDKAPDREPVLVPAGELVQEEGDVGHRPLSLSREPGGRCETIVSGAVRHLRGGEGVVEVARERRDLPLGSRNRFG